MPRERRDPAQGGAVSSAVGQHEKRTAADDFGPVPPPAGHAAEACALGACIHGTPIARRVVEALTVDDFDRPAHKTLYEAVAGLLEAGEDVDLMTVTDYLGCADQLDEVGGAAALYDLMADVPVPAHWPSYVRIVKREADRRRQVRAHVEALRRLGVDVQEVAA